MGMVRVGQEDSHYPSALLLLLGDRAPAMLAALGNLDILRQKKLALFCSVKCPGNLILQTYDLARALRDAGVTVIGGFHSPMEKECLTVLLRGTQPVIVCLARSIEKMRTPSRWQAPLAESRLLLLSPFAEKLRRATADLARKRNGFVAALAEAIFVAHAAPGSKTERFCRDVLNQTTGDSYTPAPELSYSSVRHAHENSGVQGRRAHSARYARCANVVWFDLAWGKPLLTLESDENVHLLALGARPVQPEHIREQWAAAISEAPREGTDPRSCRTGHHGNHL
jgi:hypothetical protein